jgi:glutamate N-acetyltransferase / amino-acid N-acetyltransferase
MSVTSPLGFRAAAVEAGLKPDRPDLALVVADGPCAAAGVFTTNRAQAAPVLVSREHLLSGQARAVVVNAGCANAATGERGLADAREMAGLAGAALHCRPEEVVVASTGVIGVHLPMDKLRLGIPRAAAALSRDGGSGAARAILTTDTKPKEVAAGFRVAGKSARVGGMAKGAGMIAPNMATLLAFFTTDAVIDPKLLRRALREAVGEGLNRITVDGDTSTNDMAVVLASGAAGTTAIAGEGRDYDAFRDALTGASRALAEMIVRDGEGASRVALVRVEGARTAGEADRVARTIAESPLVKTALHGGDPNWGRILAAAGRSGVEIDADRIGIWIGDVWVAENGQARNYSEATAHAAMTADPVRVRVHLGQGSEAGWMWTCDLTPGYVDINAHYRS